MSTTAPAALPPPPAPPVPPVPPGGSAPPPPPPGGPGAPLAHVAAGHSGHGSHGHALRPPRLGAQKRRETRPAGRQAPVIVQAGGGSDGSARKRDVESLRAALRDYAKKASPGPDLAAMGEPPETGAMQTRSLGQGPKKAALHKAAVRARGVWTAKTATQNAPAPKEVAPGVPFDARDMDATPNLAPGHDAKAIFDKLDRTDLA